MVDFIEATFWEDSIDSHFVLSHLIITINLKKNHDVENSQDGNDTARMFVNVLYLMLNVNQ